MDDYSTSADISSLLGGMTGEPLIPESFMIFMIVCFVLLNILTIVFFIFWIMGMVRRWKVQTAVLEMQKDIAEIKQSLAKPAESAPKEEVQSTINELIEQKPAPIAPLANTEPLKLESNSVAINEQSTNDTQSN